MRAKKDILDLLDKETRSMAKGSDQKKCENQALGERRHKDFGGVMKSIGKSLLDPLGLFPWKKGGRCEMAIGGVGKERKGQLY